MVTRRRRKERIGTVIKDGMNKSLVVEIARTTKHQLYRRIIRKSASVIVHDEKNQAKTGDKVKINETRPLSKTKKWRLVEVLK